MKNARLALVLLALSLSMLVVGCGNKGDLVRPGESPDTSASH